MNIPFVILAFLVQYPLMLAFPLLLGWWIKRKYGVGWGIFAGGVIAFMVSQVIHMPVNWALGLMSGDRGIALWPVPLMAIAAGLSAALCEQISNWVILRFFYRRARGWSSALQFGAGHGAIESILFGLLALGTMINMIMLTTASPEGLGLTGDEAVQAEAVLQAFWGNPWYTPILAGLERVFAITFHIAAVVLVMRAITHRNIGYLLAAIALHAALDAWAVWALETLGLLAVEAGVAVVALISLWLIIRLKESSPEPEPVT